MNSNPKKRCASNAEGHQRERQEVPVDQEDSVPVIVQPDLKAKRSTPTPQKFRIINHAACFVSLS